MLVFTNRVLAPDSQTEDALTRAYVPFSDTLNSVVVHTASRGGWKVSEPRADLSNAQALTQIGAVMEGNKPVLVFLHGNNNPPATCFTRCQQLEDQYGVAVIGFSWASEGYMPDGKDQGGMDVTKLETDAEEDALKAVASKDHLKEGWIARKARRYAQAKTNAQQSTESLARFLRLVASSRLATMHQKVSFAAHSLGCYFVCHTIHEQDAEVSLSAMHNVALMAGCVSAVGHAEWVGQIRPLLRVYITYANADSVLAASTVIDKSIKLGANPGEARLVDSKYRYIDFEGAAKMQFGAHRYFVADTRRTLSKPAALLFQRIFNSQLDFNPASEPDRTVYPVGCPGDATVCYMGAPKPTP